MATLSYISVLLVIGIVSAFPDRVIVPANSGPPQVVVVKQPVQPARQVVPQKTVIVQQPKRQIIQQGPIRPIAQQTPKVVVVQKPPVVVVQKPKF